MDANTKVPELLNSLGTIINELSGKKCSERLVRHYKSLEKSLLFRFDDDLMDQYYDFHKKYSGGKIAKIISEFIPSFRMPFEHCTLEINLRGSSFPAADLLITVEETQDFLDIHLGFKIKDHNKTDAAWWEPCELSMRLTEQGVAVLYGLDANDRSVIEDLEGSDRDAFQKMMSDTRDRVLFFMAIMACKNTVAVKRTVSEKTNKKRIKKGKLPLYTYHELQVTPGETSGSGGKGAGTKQGPRVHLRRGHIRRLPQGNIWVNACVVGNKEKGIVHKHYKVNKPASAMGDVSNGNEVSNL